METINIKKRVTFRSDLVQEFIKEYYDLNGVLLHFCSLEHDEKYKNVWSKIPEATKYDFLNMFVKDREEALNKFLDDQNMNNIPLNKFDHSPRYFLSLFNLKEYAPYLHACYYKGMLRDIIGTTNNHDLEIALYCVQEVNSSNYVFASSDKEEVKQYEDNPLYKIWVE
jgi:hypothetical protein